MSQTSQQLPQGVLFPHDRPKTSDEGEAVGQADHDADAARAFGEDSAAVLEDDIRHALPHFPDDQPAADSKAADTGTDR
jgi:hypothetical protein